ncbi:hypothetical protein BD770DRAFT_476871 [Pilaira anomala]|nr:hypothetical protein BD770DRAFT_476871 [Pilaira anomala]
MDLDNLAFRLGEIEKLVDMDTVIITDPKSTEMEGVMDSLTETFQKVTIAPPQKYKKYGQDQIERFIRLIQEEELTVPKSAEQCGYSSHVSVQIFLNPIEECWSKVKKNIRRNPLNKSDMLTPRIPEVCTQVTIADCNNWIKHAETYWERCLQKELGLK